jgi:hypothetical protein
MLNSLLYRDLTDACGVGLDIHCHTDLLEGITEFRKNVGVTADKLPTEKEATEIKKELEALPPLGWLNETMIARPMASNYYQRWRARGATQFSDDAWMAFAAEGMQGVPPGETPIALRESAAEEPTQPLPDDATKK